MATFGYSTIGSTTWGTTAHEIDFVKFRATESGIASAINIYGKGNGTVGQLRVAIYEDNNGTPGARLANEITPVSFNGTAQWWTVNINYTLIAGTNYWMSWWSGSNSFLSYYDSSTGSLFEWQYTPYVYYTSFGNWPDNPLIKDGGFHTVSMYVTYASNFTIDTLTVSENISLTLVNPNVLALSISDSVTMSDSFSLIRSANPKSVRIIYLVPTDRTVKTAYTQALKELISDVRNWFGNQLNNGKTFSLYSTPVEVWNASQPASYFAQSSGFTSAQRAWSDFTTISGYTPTDSNFKFVLFVDNGSNVGLGYVGLTSAVSQAFCWVTPETLPGMGSVTDRQITAHELGHAFGLTHSSNGSVMDAADGTNQGSLAPTSDLHDREGHNNPRAFTASQVTSLQALSFFTEYFQIGIAPPLITDSTAVSESLNFTINQGAGIYVIDTVTVSDTIAMNTLKISVSDEAIVTELGIDGSNLFVVLSSVAIVENTITVADSIPDHYQDTIIVTDSLSYYQDTVFIHDEISMNVSGYGYQLDVENIKIQGLRIIGD